MFDEGDNDNCHSKRNRGEKDIRAIPAERYACRQLQLLPESPRERIVDFYAIKPNVKNFARAG